MCTIIELMTRNHHKFTGSWWLFCKRLHNFLVLSNFLVICYPPYNETTCRFQNGLNIERKNQWLYQQHQQKSKHKMKKNRTHINTLDTADRER